MTRVLFISDLHLAESRPATTAAFLAFLDGPARQAESLWILGDLYEYWTADGDLDEPFNGAIADALAALSKRGVQINVFHGNRDFMLGKGFARRAGAILREEPTCIQLGAHRVALLHADSLCTDDHKYMAYRAWSRDPWRQALFRLLPGWIRHRVAGRIRSTSREDKRDKTLMIMDVNAAAAEQVFRETGADILIHGHTHRPARHALEVDGQPRQRIVLPDWHEEAVWLEWDGRQFIDCRDGTQSSSSSTSPATSR